MTAHQFTRALQRLGWTQEEAAAELGACNRQRVSEWARGARPIPPYIAAALTYRIDDLQPTEANV